jgi:glutathione S-transferase
VLQLFRAPFSTNVERVALALAHKRVEVESVEISYSDRSPVIEVSGQPLVPVLVDGDEVIPDSTRILRHLEAAQSAAEKSPIRA